MVEFRIVAPPALVNFSTPSINTMDISLLAKQMASLFSEGSFEPATDDVLAKLRNQRVPTVLLDFARSLVPRRNLWVGSGLVYPISKQIEYNEEFPEARAAGAFIIGSCPDGDFIVLKSASLPFEIGFVTHEEIVPDCSWSEFYWPICRSLYDFLVLSNIPLVSDRETMLPEDYYEAKRMNWRPKALAEFGIVASQFDFPVMLPD